MKHPPLILFPRPQRFWKGNTLELIVSPVAVLSRGYLAWENVLQGGAKCT